MLCAPIRWPRSTRLACVLASLLAAGCAPTAGAPPGDPPPGALAGQAECVGDPDQPPPSCDVWTCANVPDALRPKVRCDRPLPPPGLPPGSGYECAAGQAGCPAPDAGGAGAWRCEVGELGVSCERPEGGGTDGAQTGSADGPCVPAGALAGALGVALGFNVFVLGELDQHGTDTEGRVAAGGDATLASYGVGMRLSDSAGARDDLVVGGTLRFQDGAVPHGNAVYGALGVLSAVSFGTSGHHVGRPLDFAAAARELDAHSAALARLAITGRVTTTAGGTVTFRGDRPDLEVFELASADLAGATSLAIEVRAGATALVNVRGRDAAVRSLGFSLRGAARERVILHFPDATTLAIGGVGVQATVLAPRAAVRFEGASIDGTLVAGTLRGTGESHDHPFTGCLPALTPIARTR